jgi:hypothetical protein
MLYRRLGHEFVAESDNRHDELQFLPGNGTPVKKVQTVILRALRQQSSSPATPNNELHRRTLITLPGETEQISNYKLFKRSLPPVYTQSLFSGLQMKSPR